MKTVLKRIVFLVFLLAVGFNVYKSNSDNSLSNLTLTNIDILANAEPAGGDDNDDESSKGKYSCYGAYTPADWFHEDQIFVSCFNCVERKGRNLIDPGSCNKRQ